MARAPHMDGWQLEPWVLVRVAGLPVDLLDDLRLSGATLLHRNLEQSERHLDDLRDEGIQVLFDAVPACESDQHRRLVLALKRRLFGRKPIAAALAEMGPQELPTGIDAILVKIANAERAVDRHVIEYAASFERELRSIDSALHDHLHHGHWLDELLLSSRDLWQVARPTGGHSIKSHEATRNRWQQSGLARYLLRSAIRTTPFGGFAATALVSLEDNGNGSTAALPHGTQINDVPPRERWSDVVQVHVGILDRWLRQNLSETAVVNLAVRSNPLTKLSDTPGGTVATFCAYANSKRTIELGALASEVMLRADGASTRELSKLLAASPKEQSVWEELINSLVDVGLLLRDWPDGATDLAGLRSLAAQVGRLGDSHLAARLSEAVELLEGFAQVRGAERAGTIDTLKDLLEASSGEVPVYVDRTLNGLGVEALRISPREIESILAPALMLGRSSINDAPHHAMCDAFIARFGEHGICDDVSAFIIDLLDDQRLIGKIRSSLTPVAWLNSPLGTAILGATGESVSLERDLFEQLPSRAGQFAFAAFAQVVAPTDKGLLSADFHIVLNGLQSGRHKYLSRYLNHRSPTTDAALVRFRRQFAESEDPMPVELKADLNLNFQVHPRLTCCELEVSPSSNADPTKTIPLSDLSLRYEAAKGALRLRSARLGRDVEPIHLGFLRDLNLPNGLLLIRALSHRFGEETAAERSNVYGLIDRSIAAGRGHLPHHRPRLKVGRLILARARWAIPFVQVPRQAGGEPLPTYFRKLTQWRTENGLPSRGFVRRLSSGSLGPKDFEPAQYLDFTNPFSLYMLRRLLPNAGDGEPRGWLVLEELLPDPEDAPLFIDGKAHVSELLLEFEGTFK